MRLIRLTTDDTEAIFDNQFRDDIVLPKDGKIALQSASVHVAPVAFEVDDNNKYITYENSTLGTRTIELDEASYDETTYPNLFLDIKNKLNADTIFNGANNRVLGIEWNCLIPSGETKVVIEYKRGAPIRDTVNSELTGLQFTDNGTEDLLLTQDGEPPTPFDQYNACMITKKYLSQGCGYTRSHIYALSQSVSPPAGHFRNGMILALTSDDMTDFDPANFALSNITYGIWATMNASNNYEYYVIENGSTTLSLTVPGIIGEGDADNDDMEIIIDGDRVKLNVYQGVGRIQTTLDDFPYVAGTILYPVNIIKGGNQTVDQTPLTAVMSQLAYTPSPYSTWTPPTLQFVPYQPDTSPYLNTFEFGSESLSDYLGYAYKRLPDQFVSEATYKANFAFSVFAKHDAFLVELLNIPLKSYDAFQEQRKNLLAVMPVSDKSGEILYEVNTPFFIDIDNDFDLLLRNIRARIVQTDYQTLKTRGLTTLTILVSD